MGEFTAPYTSHSISHRCSQMRLHMDEPERFPVPCGDCYSVEVLTRKIAWTPDIRWHPVNVVVKAGAS